MLKQNFGSGIGRKSTDSEAKFHFQPPPGVAIVDEESLAGEIH